MCPRCGEPLIVVEFQGVEVDHCLDCRGTWFDTGELELVLEMAGVDPHLIDEALAAATDGARAECRCPRCSRKMRVAHLGDPPVEVDLCRAGDGIWLDAGELADLVRSLSGSGDRQNATLAEFFGDLFRHELTGETEKG